ncbi:MAG: hypothetical protein NTW87_21020 [Planctomycetota bacterium]|nr:hypothetical protein [Planctomycetota bacterium]
MKATAIVIFCFALMLGGGALLTSGSVFREQTEYKALCDLWSALFVLGILGASIFFMLCAILDQLEMLARTVPKQPVAPPPPALVKQLDKLTAPEPPAQPPPPASPPGLKVWGGK